MFMAFTFFAFLCSCTAILVTRAFLQEQQMYSGQLSQHERRQRLLQRLSRSFSRLFFLRGAWGVACGIRRRSSTRRRGRQAPSGSR